MNLSQPETVAEYIDRMRRRQGRTWGWIAGEVGVSTMTLNRWAAADWKPARWEHLAALVEALDLDPNVLLERAS